MFAVCTPSVAVPADDVPASGRQPGCPRRYSPLQTVCRAPVCHHESRPPPACPCRAPQRRSTRTAQELSEHLGWAEIRHPFHPLKGQRLLTALQNRAFWAAQVRVMCSSTRGFAGPFVSMHCIYVRTAGRVGEYSCAPRKSAAHAAVH